MATAQAAAAATDHRKKEVAKLHRIYLQQQEGAGGSVGNGGKSTFRQMSLRSGGDGSFVAVLRMLYPQALAVEVRQMVEWVTPKRACDDRAALTAEQQAEVKELFDGFDADGSGTLELEELQEAGWGEEGTVDGDAR